MPSQFDESQIISELLPRRDGRYVDVGAGDPWLFSNTSDLYQQGWQGLLIEPLAERCALLREARPRDTVINKAASNRTGTLVLSVAGELSSLDPDWPNQSTDFRPVEVDTLANILSQYPDIRDHCDLCSIDVEGHEGEVLAGIDFGVFQPRVIVIESLAYGSFSPQWPRWEPLLLDQGYEFVRAGQHGLNRFYVHR